MLIEFMLPLWLSFTAIHRAGKRCSSYRSHTWLRKCQFSRSLVFPWHNNKKVDQAECPISFAIQKRKIVLTKEWGGQEDLDRSLILTASLSTLLSKHCRIFIWQEFGKEGKYGFNNGTTKYNFRLPPQWDGDDRRQVQEDVSFKNDYHSIFTP